MSIISLNKDVTLDYNSLAIQSDVHARGALAVDGALAVGGSIVAAGSLTVSGSINGLSAITASLQNGTVSVPTGTAVIPATCETYVVRIGSVLIVSGGFTVNSLTTTSGILRVTLPSTVFPHTSFGVASFRQGSATVVSSNWISQVNAATSQIDITWSLVGSSGGANIAFNVVTSAV